MAETQSRRFTIELARLALEDMGGKAFKTTQTKTALKNHAANQLEKGTKTRATPVFDWGKPLKTPCLYTRATAPDWTHGIMLFQ